jgi:hypothetical protein
MSIDEIELRAALQEMVEVRGLEPLTSGLQSPRSAKLSYTPQFQKVGLSRFELLTSRLSGVRSNQLSYRP